MTDANPVTSGDEITTPTRSRSLLIAGGTAAAVLFGGIAFQFIRSSESGTAAEQPVASRTGTAQVAGTQRPMGDAAKVTRGGRSIVIPLKDVAEECMKLKGAEVLESMINRAVIQLECEKAGVVITQADVEGEIKRIAKQFNIPVETWLQMLQSERNISPEQYSRDVIWPMLALKKLAGKEVSVTEEDMHKAFIRNYGPKVKCRMIMFDNLRKANEVWQQARLKPDDFERLARDHSVDPNSRALGGSVPPIAKYSGAPEIENAAFKLKPGELSGVIQIGVNQFVVLKCDGYTKQVVTSIDEVKSQLLADLEEQKVQEAVANLFEQLKKESYVHNFWTGEVTGQIQQASGTASPRSRVQPASGVRR
ncbi:MAG: peptidylprolyl isomerase [Planctomycetota bacterium]|jgi:foldase protein PrsA